MYTRTVIDNCCCNLHIILIWIMVLVNLSLAITVNSTKDETICYLELSVGEYCNELFQTVHMSAHFTSLFMCPNMWFKVILVTKNKRWGNASPTFSNVDVECQMSARFTCVVIIFSDTVALIWDVTKLMYILCINWSHFSLYITKLVYILCINWSHFSLYIWITFHTHFTVTVCCNVVNTTRTDEILNLENLMLCEYLLDHKKQHYYTDFFSSNKIKTTLCSMVLVRFTLKGVN